MCDASTDILSFKRMEEEWSQRGYNKEKKSETNDYHAWYVFLYQTCFNHF